MRNTRLLERIRQMGKSSHRESSFDSEILKQSILSHLNQILNTRQGSAIIGQEYGMPDFSASIRSFDSKDIEYMEENIREVITKYEKRLKNIQIIFTPDKSQPLNITFHISGDLVGGRERNNISFQTILSSQGRVTVTNSLNEDFTEF